jgi:hypothetical protein
MAAEDRMTQREKWKVIRQIKPAYVKASRREQGKKLDHLEETLGMHRKSIIRRIHSDLRRKPRQRERGPKYGADVEDALRVMWETYDYICAHRITPDLAWMAEHLAHHGELEVTPELLMQLEEISISTIKRILKRIGQYKPRRRRRKPKESPLTKRIPVRRIPYDEKEPGHFEVDLVHHSGPETYGHYVHTLQMIDVATGWSERVAVLGRSYKVMEDAFTRILIRLPFPVLEIHSDNGGEFLNAHLERFWGGIVREIHLSRCDRDRRNDNRFVEQKNDTLVRHYLGFDRLDTVAHTLTLNRLYPRMGLYYNYFQPVMRLERKVWIPPSDSRPGRTRLYHDRATTPFNRLCATDAMLPEHRDLLTDLRRRTNPRQLRREIYETIDYLFSLPGATDDKKEDVHLTLRRPDVLHIGDESPVTLSFDRTMTVR